MKKEVIKHLLNDHNTFMCIGVKSSELEDIILEVIEVDTKINLKGRMYIDHDENDYRMRAVFDEYEIDEEEQEQLGVYDVKEWYTAFDNALSSIFGVSSGDIYAYTSEDEVKSKDDYMVTIYIPKDIYVTLQNQIGGVF